MSTAETLFAQGRISAEALTVCRRHWAASARARAASEDDDLLEAFNRTLARAQAFGGEVARKATEVAHGLASENPPGRKPTPRSNIAHAARMADIKVKLAKMLLWRTA